MSFKHVGSNLALTVVTLLGVMATLGLCSVVPLLASSAANVVVHPLSVKGVSSTTSDDPPISNVERSSFADCGVSNDVNRMAGGKIVGGVETAPNEFPWQALLQVEMEGGNIYNCGGSLVSDRWILTAAACATVPNERTKSIFVYLGLHNRSSSSTEANAKMYEGQGLLVHSGWDPYTFDNDIALVYLATSVAFTQYIRPVCLAAPTEPSYAGEYATVAGWGRASDGATSSSRVLRKVTVPVISNAQCDSYYNGSPITQNMMCTSGANGSGICGGDGGAPLTFKQPDGTWKQIGIGSFISSNGCEVGGPSGYTRLSSYSAWVQQIIAPGSDFSTTPLMFRTTTTIKTTPTTTPTTTQTIPQSTTTTTVTTTEKTTTPTTEAPTTTTNAASTTPTSTAPTTPTTTASITNQPIEFSCAGKANGNYPNPESSCSNTFYKCSNGNAYLYNCASNLVYREDIEACDWPSNVAGCH